MSRPESALAQDEDRAEVGDPFNEVFSLRKPKDFKAGLSSGAKSFAKGVVGGAVLLVAAPVMGARSGGVTGFAKGAVAGVASVVVLPIAGAVVGTTQIVRGCCNTPKAIHASSTGKIWDLDKREWVEVPTLALAATDPIFEDARKRYRQERQGRGDADNNADDGEDYYALLQVDRSASPDEIRKQYFLLARKWHPDKNPGDETSKEMFQKLGAAYQVLSSPELRKKYDTHGKEGVNDVDFMDGAMFFAMLFGSDKFNKYTGELLLTTMAGHGGTLSPGQVQRLGILREEQVAADLRHMLEAIEGGEEQFKMYVQVKAEQELGPSPYGDTMLVVLGRIYENQARIFRGGLVDGTLARFKQKTEGIKSTYTLATAAWRAMHLQHEIEVLQKQEERHKLGEASSSGAERAQNDRAREEASVEMMQKQLPLMLDTMWAANVLDIQSVVARACNKVLHEQGVPKELAKKRALALQIMGRTFQDVGEKLQHAKAAEDPLEGAQRKVEEARLNMVKKMDQHDKDESSGVSRYTDN